MTLTSDDDITIIETDGDEYNMDSRQVYELVLALEAWEYVATDKAFDDCVLRLQGRRLSHDLRLAGRLIERLRSTAEAFDLRRRYRVSGCYWKHPDYGVAHRVVKRLLGPALEFWDYWMEPRTDPPEDDLIALAAKRGDLEARLLRKRGADVEASVLKRLDMVIEGDKCVPVSAEHIAAADAALRQALGPDAHKYIHPYGRA
jgi:hypothetical protein